jgi:purine-binding chemotaxis protein CheW
VKFALGEADVGKNVVVIVVQVGVRTVGMIVDKVSDVLGFQKENLQDTPEFSASIQTQYIEKIGKLGNRLVILLDIEKVLSSEDLKAVEKAAV